MKGSRRTTAVALVLAGVLAVAGCTSGSGSSSAGSGSGSGEAGRFVSGAADSSGGGAAAAPAAPGASAAPSAQVGRQVVTTASARLTASDVDRALTRVSDLVDRAGGRTERRYQSDPASSADSDSSGGSDESGAASPASLRTGGSGGTAHLVLRVPATQLTAVLDAVGDLGRLTRVSVDTEDVTTTAVDLDARISALQTSTARLGKLLATAATTADLVAAESALTDRQAQLESLQAQRTALAGQVELATLTLTIAAEDAPVARTGFGGAVVAGWHALVATTAVLLVALGAALPWLVALAVLGAVVLGTRRLVRRVRRGSTATAQAGATGP